MGLPMNRTWRSQTLSASNRKYTKNANLLRSIAEIVGYAHKRRLFHRALSPQSVFVSDPDAAEPRVTIGNWQAGTRAGGTSIGIGSSGTEHVDAVIDDASQVYVAPEARLGNGQYEAVLDVFSLGAIAYRLFTGLPPADSIISLHDKLRAQGGPDRLRSPECRHVGTAGSGEGGDGAGRDDASGHGRRVPRVPVARRRRTDRPNRPSR